jgi:hypothetical protein
MMMLVRTQIDNHASIQFNMMFCNVDYSGVLENIFEVVCSWRAVGLHDLDAFRYFTSAFSGRLAECQ